MTLERELSRREPDLPGGAVVSDPADANVVTSLFRLAGGIGLIAIIVLSLVPVEFRPSTGFAKQLEHGVAYWICASVLTIAGVPGRLLIPVFVVLAGALELGQMFVPGRDSNPLDFLASSAGAILGVGVFSFVRDRLFRHPAVKRISERLAVRLAPFRLDLIVIAATIGFAAVVASIAVAYPQHAVGALGAALAVIMVAIAVIDAQYLLIPDLLNVAGLVLGLVHAVTVSQVDFGAVLLDAGLRIVLLAASFFLLRSVYAQLRGRPGLGLGDVKLAAVAGAWLDWPMLPITIEIAALSALLVYALRRFVVGASLPPAGRMPFGLYFAPAIWVGWCLQTAWPHLWPLS